MSAPIRKGGHCSVITLRHATIDDKAFVDDLVFTTMHGFVEATWPGDSEAHRYYYEINRFDPANTYILQLDGQDVGRISWTIHPDHIFIYELHVLADYHRRGVGREALQGVITEAELKKIPIRATVLVVNHASRQLCLSMGFEIVGVKDHRLQIQYWPKSCPRPIS